MIWANCYFLEDRLLEFCYSLIKVQRRKDTDKSSRADITAMALERLQARAAAGVPDLDGVVVGRRRQLGRVMRESNRPD